MGIYDSPSTSQSDMLKPENTEAPQEIQFSFPSSSSAYNFENGRQSSASFPHSQTRPQMQNLAPFSSVMSPTHEFWFPLVFVNELLSHVLSSEFSFYDVFRIIILQLSISCLAAFALLPVLSSVTLNYCEHHRAIQSCHGFNLIVKF